MKKILFMDIDGVLVTEWSLKQETVDLGGGAWYEPYTPEAVDAMNMIIESSRPRLVIHSSRRFQYSEDELRTIWSEVGIKYENLSALKRYSELDDKWFDHPNDEKVYDIRKYLELNRIGVEDFLVLEDQKLDIDNLCLLDERYGLRTRDAERIMRLWS